MLIDSHAHIYDEKYGDGGEAIIADMQKDGLEAIVCVGCDEQSSERCAELAENNANIYATVGVHPYYPETATPALMDKFAELAKRDKVVAIGEFGFDYHHDTYDKAAQMNAVVAQYVLARAVELPMIFHVREGAGDFYEFAKDRTFPQSGVMHCFSGSVETAEFCLKKGLYISFAGKITYRNAKNLAEVAKRVPLDRLLIETDSPYLPPATELGGLNYPKHVALVRDRIAELRGVSPEEIEQATNENAKRLFFKMRRNSE